jgi:methionyl aminopeptidase
MSADTPAELEGLRRAGTVVAETLRAVAREVRPGVSTAELDRVAARVFARHGARSGPALDYAFPGAICLSVGDEAVHGIPGPRKLRSGELVKVDVTAELDGFYADACVTVGAGTVRPRMRRLAGAAQACLRVGLRAAVAGAPIHAIGSAVEDEARRRGFTVCHELQAHGVGRAVHEEPSVPMVYDPSADGELTEGLVITVEPILTTGVGRTVTAPDGWTERTVDGAPVAHAEHTIVIRRGAPLIVTA